MKSVLIVTDVLETIRAGAEKHIYLLSKGLRSRGWQVDILVLQSDCMDKHLFSEIGVELYVNNIKRVYGPSGIRLAKDWLDILAQRQYRAIFTYHFGADLWVSLFLRNRYKGKIISMRRDDGFWMRFYHNYVYASFINPRVDFICCVSDSVKDFVLRHQHPLIDKLLIIVNGVELDRFYPDNTGKRKENFVITYVANLSPIKNHKLLIEAVRFLKGKILNLLVIIVGRDKGTLSDLKKMTVNYNLTDIIRFTGPRSDVPDILRNSDLCLQISLSEGMSNTLLEYMATAKPIIASDIPANRIVLADAGLYVNPFDNMDLAEKIFMLYSNTSLREKLGKLALERVKQKFSLEAMLNKYENLLIQ